MRISLFIACFNDTLLPDTGKAVVRDLGVGVDFPLEQTCCGQLHANTGYALEAVPMVRRFVRVFGDAEAIVTPSGSCAAMGVEDVGARFPHRVVYHPACHATRMIGVGDAPLRLLRGVEAIELV